MSKFNSAERPAAEERGLDQHPVLQRWSTRKHAVNPADAGPTSSELAPAESKPLLTDADMPPLASLTETSDYSGFLSAGVSEGLRRLALRKLFHGTAFNVTDGLDDYAEDFTKFAKLGDVITQDLRYRMAVEAERLARSTPEKSAVTEAPAEARSAAPTAETTQSHQSDAAPAASPLTLQTP